MGKKKKAELDKQYVSFEAGMKENGYSDSAIAALWETLLPFADYAFNKSHAAAYGVVSYWTAHLKANFPTEYMAALLTSTQENRDRLGLYLGDCRHRGITVLPPDVNESDLYFSAVGDDIRFGLSAIRNVGAHVVEEIIKTREEKGAFTSFTDFLDKVPLSVCNKRTIESLIKGGAFDELGANRRSLVLIHEDAVDSVVDVKRKEAQGQYDLFADMFAGAGGDGEESMASGSAATITVPDLPEWDRKEKLAFERNMLGLYVSDHPLYGLEHVIAQNSSTSISALADDGAVEDGTMVTIAGLITTLARKTTKKGDMWAIATVEDLEGSIDCLMFPSTYLTVAGELAEDLIVSMKGRVDTSKGMPELRVMEMTIPETGAGPDGPVTIALPAMRATERVVQDLRGVLEDNPGGSEVHLRLQEPGRTTLMQLDKRLSGNPSAALYASLKALLGPSCLQ